MYRFFAIFEKPARTCAGFLLAPALFFIFYKPNRAEKFLMHIRGDTHRAFSTRFDKISFGVTGDFFFICKILSSA